MKMILFAGMAALAVAGCGQGNKSSSGNASNSSNAAAPTAAAGNAAGPPAAAGGLTPEQVAAMVEKDGATKTVQGLDQGDANIPFEQVLDGIASGDQRWLALVPKIAPGVDAGTATGLEIAIAEALPRNAAGVLRLGGNGWSVEDACAYPMLEPTPEQTRAYFASAIPAVAAVTDPALEAAKTACLKKLREAENTPVSYAPE